MLKFFILLFLIIGCGGQEITIKSTQVMQFFIKILGKDEEERIGKTPLTLSAETVNKLGDLQKV